MLPKINHPTQTIKIPSTNKSHCFRPFLVKEEKILLIAKESGDDDDIIRAVKQVVNNCAVDTSLRIDDLTLTDINFLFLRIRAFSIDSKVRATYIDRDDGNSYEFEIDLNKVEVIIPPSPSPNIKISKTQYIVLRYPRVSIYEDLAKYENARRAPIDYAMIASCIDKVFDGDEVFDTKNSSKAELFDFIDSMTTTTLGAISDFLNSTPQLNYTIEYTNSLGANRKIILSSLNDFFTFR
jgi:hypothetical protein